MSQKHPIDFTTISSRFGGPVAAGIFLAFLAYFLVLNPRPGFPRTIDFASWIGTSNIISAGNASALYNLDSQQKNQQPVFYPFSPPQGYLVYNRPPFFIIPFLLLNRLPLVWAYAIWMAMLIFATVFSTWLIATRLVKSSAPPTKNWLNYLLITLCFFPTFQGLFLGQTSSLELLLLVGFFVCFRSQRHIEAGIILSLASFKPQLVLFVAILLLVRHSWKVLTGMAAGLSILAIVSFFMVGLKGLIDYVSLLSQINHWNCFAGVYPEVHQNIRGLFTSLFLPSCINAATGFSTALTLEQVNLIAFISSGFVLIPLLYILWKYRNVSIRSAEFSLVFASLSIASILISPYSNLQELTQLALAAGLIGQALQQRPTIFPAWFNFNGLIAIAIVLGFVVAVQNLLVVKFFVLFLLVLFFFLVYRLVREKEIPAHVTNSL